MKNAFSLIELIVSIIILAFIFTSISKSFDFIYKNYENSNIFEKLYFLQDKLYTNPSLRNITINTSIFNGINLQEAYVKDDLFEFKTLCFSDQNYTLLFHND